MPDPIGENPARSADSPAAPPPDPSGEAALLVVESLIHTLIARSRLSLRDAIELLDVAIDAQTALDADRAPIRGPSSQTLDLLYTIRASLRIDDDGAESTDRDR